MRVLKQQAKVRVLEQRRQRAGRVRQLRLLAQQPKLRVLEQRAKVATPTATPLQAAATMLSGSSTAAKIAGSGTAGESCHAHCHTPFRPRLPVWLPSCEVSSARHVNCGFWNSGHVPSRMSYFAQNE